MIPLSYVCQKAEAFVIVDGDLSDPAWERAAWSEDFVDIEGDAKPKPFHRTRMKMLWDEDHLYVGAELIEPHLWATLRQHDSVIFHDNDFEVFLDPDGDNHNYFEFEINALGTYWDLFLAKPYRDGGTADNGWNIPGLKSAVRLDGTLNDPSDEDRKWTLEIAFPWSAFAGGALNLPPLVGEQWRMNFSRVHWDRDVVDGKYVKQRKPEYNWVWSPQGVIDMHRPEHWGYVQFADGSDAFVPDSHLEARQLLMRVYAAQVSFHKERGRYAERSELDVQGAFEVRLTPEGYEASSGPVHVRQDSKLWIAP